MLKLESIFGFGKSRSVRNISARTCLAWASIGMILLAGIFVPLDAPVLSATQMQVSNIPGGPTGDPSIDLSHGAVQSNFSLGGTIDGSSPAYNLKASYSSNVKGAVKNWIHHYQVGELGLGWVIEHPRIFRMNNGTGRESDDSFVYYAAGRGIQNLKYLSRDGDFETYTFEAVYQPTTKIQRFVGNHDSYWVVTQPNGVKYYYGGKWGSEDPDNYSDDFKQVCAHLQTDGNPSAGRCQSSAIEYGVQWKEWVGVSQNPKNQTNIEVVWNLSRIESITGKATTLSYVNNIQDVGRQVGNLKPKAFSQSAYLYRVQQKSGAKTVIGYCAMADGSSKSGPDLEDEAPPAHYDPIDTDTTVTSYSDICAPFPHKSYIEFADPHTEASEPDGFQERIKRAYIGGSVSFVAGSVAPHEGTVLTYDFLKGENTPVDMTKRILIRVQRQTYSEETTSMLDAAPPTRFTYWGQDQDDQVHVGTTDFSNISHNDTGAYYGAIKSITSSTGLIKTYTYKKQALDIAREVEVPSAIKNHRTALFSDGYILLVGADSDGTFTLEVVEWTARGWEITYTYSGGTYPIPLESNPAKPVYYNPYKFITMQPTFFAFAIAETDKINIVSKNSSNMWHDIAMVEPSGKVSNVIIELRSNRELIYYLHAEPMVVDFGSRKRHFAVSNYRVDSGEVTEGILTSVLEGGSGDSVDMKVAMAVAVDRVGLSTLDPHYAVSGQVAIYEPKDKTWSTTNVARAQRKWCLPNYGDILLEGDVTYCAELGHKAVGYLQATFDGDLFLATISGLQFSHKIAPGDKVHYFDVAAPFVIGGTSEIAIGNFFRNFPPEKKCIDITGGKTADGTNIQLWDCNGHDSQKWTYDQYSGEIQGPSGKCMDVHGAVSENGRNIQLYECHGGEGQKWTVHKSGGEIKGIGGKCLNRHEAGIANGTNIELWDCNDLYEQYWKFAGSGGYSLTPESYELRNVTTDPDGELPYVENRSVGNWKDYIAKFPMLDDELKLLDKDIRTIGHFHPSNFWNEAYGYATGIGSFIGSYWLDDWELDAGRKPWDWQPDTPMKYAISAGVQSGNRQLFYSTYLQANRMIAGVTIADEKAMSKASVRADVSTANCTYRAFDGVNSVEEPIYYNPDQSIGWLQRYQVQDGDSRISKRVYPNVDGGPTPDLGCVGAIGMTRDSLTTYNGPGKRNFFALYPRLKKDGTSVMLRSLGDVKGLGDPLSQDDIRSYEAIARAKEALEEIQEEGKALGDLGYALMAASMILDILTMNWVGLYFNAVITAEFTGFSVELQKAAQHEQAALQHAVHKLGTVHQQSNIVGSGFSLYNTSLLRREADGSISRKGDIINNIKKGKIAAEFDYMKKYDPDSGVITLQTNLGPYLRTLVNGTIGVTSDVSTGDHMTAGELHDVYPLGLGRNFITYEKVNKDGKYTCLQNEEQRASMAMIAAQYDGPCFFGTQGKVVIHRVIDEAGVGQLDSIVVDTVTFNDGVQTTKVAYDFESATAGHDGESANYNKVIVSPGGRNSGNGHIERLMYNGVEEDVSVHCETLHIATGTYYDCLNVNDEGKVDSPVYRDYLRGMVYQHAVYENGKPRPQMASQTWHKVQVVKRPGFPDAVRVLVERTDSTRDDVTTATHYKFNDLGQKIQTDVSVNHFDHDLEHVNDETISTSHVYAWETDAYRDAFKAANRYRDVVQTTSLRESWGYPIVGLAGKCIDVASSEIENGTNIQLWHCNGSDAQKWTFDENTGELKGLGGKCIDVEGAKTDNGTNIRLWACNGHDSQKWTFVKNTGEIKGLGGKCIDVEGAKTDDGTNIRLWACNGHDSQKWQWLSPDAELTGVYDIIGIGDKCVDLEGAKTTDGTNIQLWECNDGANQRWWYDPWTSEIVGLGGKCVDVEKSGTTDGTNIRLWHCNGTDAQKWQYDPSTGALVGLASKCIDVEKSQTVNGANIRLWHCNGTDAQKWQWVAPAPAIEVPSQLIGSNATSYSGVRIEGLNTRVQLPHRSYVYQAENDESGAPVFNPGRPGSKWIALMETATYDGETGIPTVTVNVQTNRHNSVLLTHSEPKVAYATFGNVNVGNRHATYTGFETYEDLKHAGNFINSNGLPNAIGYSGEKAYGADTGKISVKVDTYYPQPNRFNLLSAWVKPSDGETCQVSTGDKTAESQQGDGEIWQYLEVTSHLVYKASVTCDQGGYIDDVLLRPVDSTFTATAHDSQYRVTESIGNNGVVTHLSRDGHNRTVASYQNAPDGRVRILGFPIAGFSLYDGFGLKTDKSVLKAFAQAQPNHSGTVLFQDDTRARFEPSLSDGQGVDLVGSRRFALQALTHGTLAIKIGNDSDDTQLTLTTEINSETKGTQLVLGQDDVSEPSKDIPGGDTDRVLTWVVIDQFSAVFVDGNMVISTNKLTPLPDSSSPKISFPIGSFTNVFVGHDPVFSRSFHDAFGRTIQTQSIALDDDDHPTKVKLSQVLYDGWGKPSVQTKLAMLDQALGDYDAGWVKEFDWSNDRIAGGIKSVFKGKDKGRPFTRTRYADSPLLRPERQSLLPGNEFQLKGPRAETFSYSAIGKEKNGSLLGGHHLYEFQNSLPYTDTVKLESTVITDKAGRTVSTKHGNENHGGYIEWAYQYDYGTGNAFQTTTALTPNYNAAEVDGHEEFKNVSSSWDNRGMVTTNQEPDLSGYALVVRDNLGRPRFMRKNVADLSSNVSGVSYITYDLTGRISETGVLKNVSKNVDEYRALAHDSSFPTTDQTCWQKRYLYDTDLQTGNTQKFLTGRTYGLVGNMNLIFDNPTESCFDGYDKGKSHIFYRYDQRGRVVSISEVTNQTVRNSAYQNDNLGNRLAVTYPDVERMTSDNQSTGFEDLSQKRKRELLFNSDDQLTVHYPRNPLGQLSAVCDTADCSVTKYASKYRYDVFGKIVSNKLNNETLTQTMTYDFQERLTKLETTDDNGTVFAETLSYDTYQGGNIREADYSGTGLGQDGKHSYKYGYDIWGRLIEASRFEGEDVDTPTKKYAYTYDHNGNILSKKITGATDHDVLTNYTYAYHSGKNQLASITDSVSEDVRNFTHNDYGAITSFTNNSGNTNEYTLDSRNDRVHRVTNEGYAADYFYDPLNRRIGKVDVTGASPDLSGQNAVVGLGRKCIDVAASGIEDGTNIQLWTCNGTDAQKWTFDENPGEIKGLGGKCIDVADSGTVDGTNIYLWHCNGTDAQKWTFDVITGEITGLGGKCIDVAGSGIEDGTNIQLWACNGTDAQKWEWVEPPASASPAVLTMKEHDGGQDGWEITHSEPVSVDSVSVHHGPLHDDKVSAITVADGHTVEVYEHPNYQGQQLTFVGPRTVGVSDLDQHGMNDAISSYKLYLTPPEVPVALTLSQHDGGQVGWEITQNGEVSVEQLSAEHDDQISALSVSDGHTVEVYEHPNYQGQQLTFVGPQTVGFPELDSYGMNDAISSYKLYLTPEPVAAAPDLAGEHDSGRSATDNITNQAFGLSISGCAATGSAITLYQNAFEIDGAVWADTAAEACVGGASQFSKAIDLGADGDYLITFVAEDAEGNVSVPSAHLSITIDTIGPEASTGLDLAAEDDTGTSETDNITDRTSGLTITGCAEADSAVTFDQNGIPIAGAVFAETSDGACIAGTKQFAKDIDLESDGVYAITVLAVDIAGNEGVPSAPLTVIVTAANQAPVAMDDSVVTVEGAAVDIDVLVNDTDSDAGDTLSVISVGGPSHGTVVIAPGSTTTVTYTPNADFNGTDSFEYTVSDGTDTDTGTVIVTVTAANQAPVAMDDSVVTGEGAPVDIDVLVNDKDPDAGDTLSVISVSTPSHGTVVIAPGSTTTVSYTPNFGFDGTDSFEYTVSDGTDTDTGTVTVTVIPVTIIVVP